MMPTQIITEIFAEKSFARPSCSLRSDESLDSWIEKWLRCILSF